jgi:hypothetical protein
VVLADAGNKDEACAMLARGAEAIPESAAEFERVAAGIRARG